MLDLGAERLRRPRPGRSDAIAARVRPGPDPPLLATRTTTARCSRSRASPASCTQPVLNGAQEAIARVDLTHHAGLHPRVGVVDVAPIVYLDEDDKGAACAEALVLADELGRLGVPVYLYGELGRRAHPRGAAPARRPRRPRRPTSARAAIPTAGATLVAARPPLVAFNVEIDAPLETAKRDREAPARRARRPRARPAAHATASRSRPTSRTTRA